MITKKTIVVNSAGDELEISFSKNDTITIYIKPNGDEIDFVRHASFDIESVEDLDEIITQLNSYRFNLIK